MSRLFLIAVIVLVAGCTAPSGVRLPQLYYIAPDGSDTGVGSREDPFRTMTYATSLMRPGDTLLLKSGVYSEPLHLEMEGLPQQTFRIAAVRGDRVILTSPEEWAATISGSYIVLENLIIRSPRNGLLLDSQSRAITLTNLTIEGKNTTLALEGEGSALFNCTVNGGERGILVSGDRVLIDHSTIEDARVGVDEQGNNAFIRFSRIQQNDVGLLVQGNATRLSHLIVTHNRDGIMARNAQKPWMAHLTVVNNNDTGVYLDALSVHPIVINSIVTGNQRDIIEQSLSAEVIHTLSLVDPLLSDSFHLKVQSPAIAQGLPLIGEESDGDGHVHGEEPSLGAFEYTGPKEPALSISNIRFIPAAGSIAIFWETNKPASTRVEYGNTTQYNNASVSEDDSIFHQLTIDGLSPERTYFFRLLSRTRTELAEEQGNSTTLPGEKMWYVSADGTGKGNGSFVNPWNLQTLLSHPFELEAGQRVVLKAGTYEGCFYSVLRGTEKSPILLEGQEGERPIIQPSKNCSTATLTFGGPWVHIRNLEFTDPHPNRTANETNSTPGLPQGIIIQNQVTGVRLAELYMHDLAGTAIHVQAHAQNISIVSSIITTVGIGGQDDAVLLESPVTFQDNIIASTSARGLVAEEGGTIEGNVVFGSGDFSLNATDTNYDIGTNSFLESIIFSHNVGFQTHGVNVVLGHGGCTGNMSWNYFNGGDVSVLCSIEGGGNTLADASVSGTNGDTEPIPLWIRPHSNSKVFTTIVATGSAFRLNLSTLGVRMGELYELHNVQDYDNDIQAGIWNGIPITISMTAHTIHSPVRGTMPTMTFPAFGVFRLIRK